jgi:RHS repeat-associated protein
VSEGTRHRFTSKERDNESGLDYFLARYYSSQQGRFTSVDPSNESIRLPNPQTFNRYAYVSNNPLRYVDPDGRFQIETAVDLISLASSIVDFYRNPGIVTGAMVIWDAAAAILPGIPGSWVTKAGKWISKVGSEGYNGLKAAGIVGEGLVNAHEIVVNNDFLRQGVALLGQGDDSVRQVLGIRAGDKAADFLGVKSTGEFVIAEAKASNVESAVKQLDNTAKALIRSQGNDVKFSAEIVVPAGQKLQGGYQVNAQKELEYYNQKQSSGRCKKLWEGL